MESELILITVTNWAKYNPRNDIKKYSWFRFDWSFASSPQYFHLDCQQKWMWVLILCFSSQHQGASFIWSHDFAATMHGIKRDKQIQTLSLFEKMGMISISQKSLRTRARAQDSVSGTGSVPYERTNERTYVRTQSEEKPFVQSSIERAYQLYPRKEGKSTGMKKLAKVIKTEQDSIDLVKATENYAKHVSGTERQFIKHFSTFVSEWRDWVEPPKTDTTTRWDNFEPVTPKDGTNG